MTNLEAFTVCAWETANLRRETLEVTRDAVRREHPEAGIIETCQRIEAVGLRACGCTAPARHRGTRAVEHLAALAAGLESAVLGEYQVLGQVRAGIGPLRDRCPWVDDAIAAARRLRAEAGFAATTGHLLDAALALAPEVGRESLLVIGAGAAGRDVARRGRTLGVDHVFIASRRAPEADSAPISGWIPLEEMANEGPFDVVVACLGSGAHELNAADLPEADVYVDLGSPPNLSPKVPRTIALGAIIATLRADSVEGDRRAVLRRRLAELVAARAAATAETAETPLGRLRRGVELVRAREVARISRLHPELPVETIETITKALVNQLLHSPSQRLREMDDPALAARVAELFIPEEANT